MNRHDSPRKKSVLEALDSSCKHKFSDTEARLEKLKAQARTDIKPHAWARFQYAQSNATDQLANIVYDDVTRPIDRINRSDVTPESFYHTYMIGKGQRPVVISGCLDDWPATSKWTMQCLTRDFGDTKFKCGKSDSGKPLRLRFKTFADYCSSQQDDSPVYLFHHLTDDKDGALLADYQVPDVMPFDFFNLVGRKRPPYRWFCVGPKRSGSAMHKDPLGTSAWNAVLSGVKLWTFFEPQVTRRRVEGDFLPGRQLDDEQIYYCMDILPRVKEHIRRGGAAVKVYEVLQRPGDVIYVPAGWWHGVVNLEDCVSVTQNFVGYDNFDMAWNTTRHQRRKLARTWLEALGHFRTELYDRARHLNQEFPDPMDGPYLHTDSSSSSSSSSSSDSEDDEDGFHTRPGADCVDHQILDRFVPPWLGGKV